MIVESVELTSKIFVISLAARSKKFTARITVGERIEFSQRSKRRAKHWRCLAILVCTRFSCIF